MFKDLFSSVGLKRTLGLVLLLAGQAADTIPVLAPAKPFLDLFGSILGALGLGHAAVKGTLLPKK